MAYSGGSWVSSDNGRGGGCKLDSHIGRAERLGVDVGEVVAVYARHYLVAALQGYALYGAPHLSVSYKCYFHDRWYAEGDMPVRFLKYLPNDDWFEKFSS